MRRRRGGGSDDDEDGTRTSNSSSSSRSSSNDEDSDNDNSGNAGRCDDNNGGGGNDDNDNDDNDDYHNKKYKAKDRDKTRHDESFLEEHPEKIASENGGNCITCQPSFWKSKIRHRLKRPCTWRACSSRFGETKAQVLPAPWARRISPGSHASDLEGRHLPKLPRGGTNLPVSFLARQRQRRWVKNQVKHGSFYA